MSETGISREQNMGKSQENFLLMYFKEGIHWYMCEMVNVIKNLWHYVKLVLMYCIHIKAE